MQGKRLIEKIKLQNILSFGDKGEEIELQPLNVIIGQNASGKSNLVDIFKLLRSLPRDNGLGGFLRKNGGISEWKWKGEVNSKESLLFIENLGEFSSIAINLCFESLDVRYELLFGEDYQRPFIYSEDITNIVTKEIAEREENVDIDVSMLSQDIALSVSGKAIRERFLIKKFFRSIKAYTDLQTNRKSEIRQPQLPDSINDFLEEDGGNLTLLLNDLEHKGKPKDKIVENLKRFYPRIKDYSVRILGGTVQLFIREKGLEKPISAMRLSDGTLRYLCLLAILCHPDPPPLICIEEPEVGLHPDILPTIAELMIEASQRTQLIVTTHSDILVSAFSDVPEAVMVCEYDDKHGTQFRRLDEENLKEWLNEYSLGELWLKGKIGGTRW